MHTTKPLPQYLVQRFQGWKATTYTENESWYRRLADDGQHPRAMLITCCDSRVHATSIFGAEQGEFFLHRNIANLVPPYKPDGAQHGTSAAIEYAVTVLKVAHIIIMGHSNGGGVAGCLDMCAGRAPELDQKESFVGRWMDILRPGYERIKDLPEQDQAIALEKEAVLVSLQNLKTFPFVADDVESGKISIHGLWHNIGEGSIEEFLFKEGKFCKI